jgi:nucleotide-binding universal stress UspA family protein
MKTILVPLDGSARAEQVLPYAQQLALLLGGSLHLLQVVPDVHKGELFEVALTEAYSHVLGSAATQREYGSQSWETQRNHAEGYLDSLAIALRTAEIQVEYDVRLGDPATIIVEVAEERRAALLAMATHGHSGVKRWALGSVTDKVVHAATTPVFVVRSAALPRTDAVAFHRILVPLDGSALARQALPLAADLARSAHASVVLFEAVASTLEAVAGFPPTGRPIPQLGVALAALREQAAYDLGAAADVLRRQDVPATVVVANGHAAELIADEAERHQADLIVMATHGYSGIRRWALGSVADKVLHIATVPLILVRAEQSNT